MDPLILLNKKELNEKYYCNNVSVIHRINFLQNILIATPKEMNSER